jgi:hypothetical protein
MLRWLDLDSDHRTNCWTFEESFVLRVLLTDVLPVANVASAETYTMVQSIRVCVFGRIAPMNGVLKESCGNKKTSIKSKQWGNE